MIIEKSGFLLMAGTLAAGGVGGWLAHDVRTNRAQPIYGESTAPVTPVTTALPSATPAAVTVVPDRVPPPPACDDNLSVGTTDECPPMGPADEGVCTNFAAKRCAEFKSAFKPKVAQAAVACLKTLKGAACDPARVNLCGHSALMNACPVPIPDPTPKADSTSAAPSPSPVDMSCDSIVKGCAATPMGPTSADCRQTLSGMTDAGRASMVDCMATHCADKGLIGCEGVKKL
ncbi:MAG: hypothetical protein ABIQ16_00770 [Polyangiaceae bacterium]